LPIADVVNKDPCSLNCPILPIYPSKVYTIR
jgi:hypothetical protein